MLGVNGSNMLLCIDSVLVIYYSMTNCHTHTSVYFSEFPRVPSLDMASLEPLQPFVEGYSLGVGCWVKVGLI